VEQTYLDGATTHRFQSPAFHNDNKRTNSVPFPIVAAFQPNLGTANFMSWMPNSNNGINDLWNGDFSLSPIANAHKANAYVNAQGNIE
jgi:hypothetical protein